MAHNLNFNTNNNEYSFFSVKEKAWHGLGKIVEDYPTSAEAIKLAQLDYDVIKQPLYTISTEGKTFNLKNNFATVRQDTGEALGIVGRKYEIIQNIDAFTFFDSIVGGDGIQYETAGALGNGEKIFITAKLPNYIKVGRKDLIEQYIFLVNTHDGSEPITAAFTPVRIVCNNTLNMALKSLSNKISIRHTADAKTRLEQAHKIMGISNSLSKELEEIFNHWSKVKISDEQTLHLIKLVMSPNKEVFENVVSGNFKEEFSKQFEDVCGRVFEYAMINETQQMQTTAGTLFGAYNAITGYYQNVKDYKSADQKLNSILYGTAFDRTRKAFDLCMNADNFLN